MSWSYTDETGLDQTRYKVRVFRDAAMTDEVVNTGYVNSAATTWAPSAGLLTDLQTYWYEVRAGNATGASPWATGSFVYDAQQRGAEPWRTSVPFDLGGWGLDVGVHNGEARLSRDLYAVPAIGPAHTMDLTYSSQNIASAGMLGYGWSSGLTQTLWRDSTSSPTQVVWSRGDGTRVVFTGSGTTWTPMSGHFETLTVSGPTWTVKEPDQTTLVFSLPSGNTGKLARIEDRFGKQLVFTWGATSATVASPGGATTTTLNYPGGSLITSILDPAGRIWTLGYTNSDLISITEPDPDGAGPLAAPVTLINYHASTHRVAQLVRARSVLPSGSDAIVWDVDYDSSGRVSAVIDPEGDANHGRVGHTFTFSPGQTEVRLLKTYSPTYSTSTYTLDALGRVTRLADPLGAVTKYAWNTPANTLERVEVPSNEPGDPDTWTRTSYTYTTAGNLQTENTGVTVFEDDTTAGTPITTRYVYNSSNDVTETHVADGTSDEAVTINAYDTAGTGGTPGHLISSTRNGSEVTQYAYNASDQLIAERDPKGVVTRHTWTGANETQTVANCTGGASWQSCDATGTLDASTNVTTNAVFNPATTAGKLGLPDSVALVLTWTAARQPLDVRSVSYVYDTLGRTTSEADAAGTTTHEWDQLGNEIRTTAPGNLMTTRTLDLMNRVTSEAAPLLTTSTAYDAAGNVVSTTAASQTASRTYDGAGNLVSETVDPGTAPHLNLTTEHAYDDAGREIATRNPDLTVTRTFYDAQGQVSKTVENCTSSTTSVWAANDAGWKSCTGSGTQNATWNVTTTYGYDDRGNKTSQTAPSGRKTTWTYDDLDRVTKVVENDVTNPTLPTEDVTTEYAYDAAGNQIAVKSPTAAGGASGYTITRSEYDNLGRVTRTIENCTISLTAAPGDPAWKTCAGTGTANATTNVVTTFTYDADGNRLSVTSPNPAAASGTDTSTVTTRYAYDAASRLCRVLENATAANPTLTCASIVTGKTTSANVLTEYEYDTHGNLSKMTDANGNQTIYGYDARGRMTSLDQPDVTSDLRWTYQENADGTSTKTQTNRGTGAGTVVWTYDPAGRLVSRAYQDAAGVARTTVYTYTGAGSAWTAADTAGTITATNDRMGRPTQVTVSSDSYATTSFGYSFTSPTRTDPSGAYTMTLDNAGRITAIDDPLHTANWQFTYGANGELVTTTWPTTTALTTTSSFDALGRLSTRTTTPGPRASYTEAYNRAGNRLTEASTITGDPSAGTATTGYDALGRLVTYGAPGRTLAAAWDEVPNRTTLTTDGTPVTTTFDDANRPTSGGYTYDADGRMTARPGQVLTYDSLGRLAEVRTAPGSTLVARYSYDALDRLWKVERPGQATIRFRYAGTTTAVAQVVEDGVGVLRSVTTGPEGTVLQDWLGTGQRLYGTNGHHDTTFTTDGAGTVTASLRYDPWGNLTSSTGTLPDWRFQGSWADTTTNLAWSVARWYDPAQGTFITEDTLLGSPETPASRHLYAYSQGDPVGGWDPGGRLYKDFSFARQRPSGFTFTTLRVNGDTYGKVRTDIHDSVDARIGARGGSVMTPATVSGGFYTAIRSPVLPYYSYDYGRRTVTVDLDISDAEIGAAGKLWDGLAYHRYDLSIRVGRVTRSNVATWKEKRTSYHDSTVCYGFILDSYSDDGCLKGFGESAGLHPSKDFTFPRAYGDRFWVEVIARGSVVLGGWGWAETKVHLSGIRGRITWR